jgi:hypothetical protein
MVGAVARIGPGRVLDARPGRTHLSVRDGRRTRFVGASGRVLRVSPRLEQAIRLPRLSCGTFTAGSEHLKARLRDLADE